MAKENIYRAMGSLAYAIAMADGGIQQSEKETIVKLALQELKLTDADKDWINKMFTELESQQIGMEDAYNYAMDTLEANRHDYDFDEVMKKRCMSFMKKIADAFGETDRNELSVITRFEADLSRF